MKYNIRYHNKYNNVVIYLPKSISIFGRKVYGLPFNSLTSNTKLRYDIRDGEYYVNIPPRLIPLNFKTIYKYYKLFG